MKYLFNSLPKTSIYVNNEFTNFSKEVISMSSGTVKFFNGEKGFGFITPDSGADLFFHISEVQGQQPRDGDKVEFEVGQGKKGPCAVSVKVKGN